MKPASIPFVGRFAVVADPGKAWFSLFRPKNPVPLRREVFALDELRAKDPEAARRFYDALGGWGVGASAVPGAPPMWLCHVAVPDVDAACARAERLGGRVEEPPHVVDDRRCAVVRDPTGALIGFLQVR
jgi:predicted enzyme related to lactoylglutathione lyase